MKRSYVFVRSVGSVKLEMPDGTEIEIPLFPGILKHPSSSSLPELLNTPAAIRKYTLEAIRKVPWPVLKAFPKSWIESCLQGADIRPGRRQALIYLLSGSSPARQ